MGLAQLCLLSAGGDQRNFNLKALISHGFVHQCCAGGPVLASCETGLGLPGPRTGADDLSGELAASRQEHTGKACDDLVTARSCPSSMFLVGGSAGDVTRLAAVS